MDDDAGRQREVAALARVRAALAHLGRDERSAPEVPPEITARIVAGLRNASRRETGAPAGPRPPAHSVRAAVPRRHIVGLVVGVGAAIAAIVIGATMVTRVPASTRPAASVTASSITVPAAIPLSDSQLIELLSVSPQFGPLADPQRRMSCLRGLGYPATTAVLGARPVNTRGRPGILMLLPSEVADNMRVVVVEPRCDATHTATMADTLVKRR